MDEKEKQLSYPYIFTTRGTVCHFSTSQVLVRFPYFGGCVCYVDRRFLLIFTLEDNTFLLIIPLIGNFGTEMKQKSRLKKVKKSKSLLYLYIMYLYNCSVNFTEYSLRFGFI